MKEPLSLPLTGYSRASQLLPFLPFGKTTLFSWSADGRFPKPVKLSETITAWSNKQVHAWFDMLECQENNDNTFEEGELCAKSGGSVNDNPYPHGVNTELDTKRNIWYSGFAEGEQEKE